MAGSGCARPVLTPAAGWSKDPQRRPGRAWWSAGCRGLRKRKETGSHLLPSSKVLDGRGGGREAFGRKRSVWGVGLEEEVH